MRLPRPCLILAIILNALPFSGAQVPSYTDAAVLQYAKSVDVAKLDSTLSPQRLEDWLRGPAKIDELNWYVSRDCDLKDPVPDADGNLPLCVKVGFRRGNITGFGVLRVGTLRHGVSGQPAFQYLDVLGPYPVGTYDKLSDFPGYLDGMPQSQTASHVKVEPSNPSSCSKAHGWMRISTDKFVGNLSCFSPEINGHYASIGGGGVNGRGDVSIQIDFLSKPGTHSCKTPMVIIELREGTDRWDAYRVRNGQFGDCTITQHFEHGRALWKGHVAATLVVVKGDTETGSPRHLHSEKDSSGNLVSKSIQIDWKFDSYSVKSR